MEAAEMTPLTVEQVGRFTGQTDTTVLRWIGHGLLRQRRDGRIDRVALVAFTQRHHIPLAWGLIEREMLG